MYSPGKATSGGIQHDGKTIRRSGRSDGAQIAHVARLPERFLDWRADLCGRADIHELLRRLGTGKTGCRNGRVHDAGGAVRAADGSEPVRRHRQGAGTLVPITGFANAIAAPAVEFKTEGFVLGVGAKMFTIAGPVIVYGLAASVVYGFIYWLYTIL